VLEPHRQFVWICIIWVLMFNTCKWEILILLYSTYRYTLSYPPFLMNSFIASSQAPLVSQMVSSPPQPPSASQLHCFHRLYLALSPKDPARLLNRPHSTLSGQKFLSFYLPGGKGRDGKMKRGKGREWLWRLGKQRKLLRSIPCDV
jgi:hypothetical protein